MHKSIDSINLPYLRLRRSLELLLIIVLSPVFLIIFFLTAVWIFVDSRGSILFCQLRPGKNGKLFKIYKFRSMHTDANSTFLTLKNDTRITKSGKFIRRYRIDELPQIYNILKGEMSLIGPRPVPVEFLARYEQQIANYQLRHRIKPGIMGLAQARQGYTTTVAEEAIKLKYDLFYIKSLSFKIDLFILLHSLKAIGK